MTSDALLTDADREEALSRAYVRAVAGFAGYTVSEEDFDRDGIDLRIHAGGDRSPSIGLQLKATTGLGEASPGWQLPLPSTDRATMSVSSGTLRFQGIWWFCGCPLTILIG